MQTYNYKTYGQKSAIRSKFGPLAILNNCRKKYLRLFQVEVLKKVARLEGFEPPTYRFVAGPSIQLR